MIHWQYYHTLSISIQCNNNEFDRPRHYCFCLFGSFSPLGFFFNFPKEFILSLRIFFLSLGFLLSNTILFLWSAMKSHFLLLLYLLEHFFPTRLFYVQYPVGNTLFLKGLFLVQMEKYIVYYMFVLLRDIKSHMIQNPVWYLKYSMEHCL